VTAGGSDIWGTYDAFRLLSQPLAGDGTFSARVDAQTNTSAWAKAGVMIRASSDPGSPYFAELITPGNGLAVQWRTAQGGASSQVSAAGTVPAWLQISRAGSTYTAYTSADGVTWTPVPGASVSLTMPGTLLAGLAVTSHKRRRHGFGHLRHGHPDQYRRRRYQRCYLHTAHPDSSSRYPQRPRVWPVPSARTWLGRSRSAVAPYRPMRRP